MDTIESTKKFLDKLDGRFVVYEFCWFFFCLAQFLSAKAGNIANSEGDPMLALKYVLDIQDIYWWMFAGILATEILICFHDMEKGFLENLIYLLVFRTLTFLMLFFLPIGYGGN